MSYNGSHINDVAFKQAKSISYDLTNQTQKQHY